VLYRAVAGHLQTWLALSGAGQVDGQGDQHRPPTYVEQAFRQAFRKYLECGILAHGFARVWCEDCAHDYSVAFSCKGRAVCPSCNARRMEQTAAHLVDHFFPHLPVRQWVLSVPKRLRYFMQRDGAALNSALRIFLRVIEQCLLRHCPGVATLDRAAVHIGAAAVAQVQAQVRTRILRAFASRGLIVGRAVLVALPVAPNGPAGAASGPGEAQWSAQWSWRRRQRGGFEGGCRDDIRARVVGFPIPSRTCAIGTPRPRATPFANAA
jgi:hypothetical protein